MGKLGVFSWQCQPTLPGMDLTLLNTQEVDFTLTFTTQFCKFLTLVP